MLKIVYWTKCSFLLIILTFFEENSSAFLRRRGFSLTGKKKTLPGLLKSSYALRRSMLIHLIVSVLLFTIILFFTFQDTVVRANEKELQEAQASLTHAQMLNDTYLRSISDYMVQEMDSYEVQGLLYSAGFTNYLSIRSRKVYDTLKDVSNLISSVQLVNYNTKTVLDGNGRYSFDLYGDQGLLTLLSTIEPSSRTRIYFYPRQMNTAASQIKSNIKAVVSMIFYLNKAGALVVNLDADTYQQLILSNYANQTTKYTLVNEKGLVFASSDDSAFANPPENMEVYQQILDRSSDQGSISLENGRKNVQYIRTTGTNVVYMAVTELDSVYPGSRNFWNIIGLSVLFLAASLLLSLGLAWISSKPILKLHRSVSSSMETEGNEAETNEFRFIENAYHSVVERNQSLREQAEIYQREREDQMFLNLMNPATPSLRPSAAAIAEMDALMPGNIYQVIALMPDRKQIALETDAQIIRKTLAETAEGLFPSLGTVRAVMPPSFQVLFILNPNENEKDQEKGVLVRILSACREALNGKPVYMGVGQQVGALDDLELSYAGAEEALHQAYMHHLDKNVNAVELRFPDIRDQSYDYEMDGAIGKAIRHMDRDAAEQIISQYVEKVSYFTHSQFVRILLHLSVTFNNLENSLQIETDDASHSLDITTVMHWDMTDAKTFFITRAIRDIAQLGNMKQQRSGDSALVEQVNEMIEANIYNPDFSINIIADHFSFSVNYLRSLYKSASGESLSGRITRRRLETACDLLDHTDETIESITDKLGFSTRNYFFTFFKKHMGMTPNQYRNREQNEKS